MKQTKPGRGAAPLQMWCEDCRVRIAPYEDFVTHNQRNLHRQCFTKSERRPAVPTVATTDVDPLMAQTPA